MVKPKPEPVSSPITPPMGSGIKRSSPRGRGQDRRSPIAPVMAANTAQDAPGPSRSTASQWPHRKSIMQNMFETEGNQNDSEADDSDSTDDGNAASTPDQPPQPRRKRAGPQSSLHKGDTERYVKTVAKYSPAVAPPRTTSSKRKDGTEKRTLHRFSNEEHRFIWFYRNDLGASRGDTYVHFNEYFGLHIRKDSIANTFERLKQKLPAEICEAEHTEPWAVGENYVIPATENMEDYSEEDAAGYSDESTDEDTDTPEIQPARNKIQSAKRTPVHAGGERSGKKHDATTGKSRSSLLTSSSSRGSSSKRRTSHQINDNGSPVPKPQASGSRTGKSSAKRKVVFDIDSDSSEHGPEIAKKRSKSRKEY